MRIVTVNLPEMYLQSIAELQSKGKYPSRSEAIRVALRKFLRQELAMVEKMMNSKAKADKNEGSNVRAIFPAKIDMRSIRTGWK